MDDNNIDIDGELYPDSIELNPNNNNIYSENMPNNNANNPYEPYLSSPLLEENNSFNINNVDSITGAQKVTIIILGLFILIFTIINI